MKKTLICGSTCIDIILSIKKFPQKDDDLFVTNNNFILGGTAYNVSDVLRQSKVPYILCSPVGTGIYGELVERKLSEKRIPVFARVNDRENGCCYCLIDSEDHHAFLSNHGAEYLFSEDWYKDIDMSDVDMIYFAGLELEEKTTESYITWLEKQKEKAKAENRNLTFIFAPGPRVNFISKHILDRAFALNPIVHLNDKEAMAVSETPSTDEAAKIVFKKTGNSVIITRGEKGSFCYDAEKKKGYRFPGFKAEVIDTIGAGDAHCGTVISSLKEGFSLQESVLRANKYAAAIVGVVGATMPDDRFQSVFF